MVYSADQLVLIHLINFQNNKFKAREKGIVGAGLYIWYQNKIPIVL